MSNMNMVGIGVKMSWNRLESQAAEIAEFGKKRFQKQGSLSGHDPKRWLAARASVHTDHGGWPFVCFLLNPHPQKGTKLRRDPRFAIHCSVTDMSGESGEFIVTGSAKFIEDPDLRALAVKTCPV